MRSRNRVIPLALLSGLTAILVLSSCHEATTTADAGSKPATISLSPEQRSKIRIEALVAGPFRQTMETTGSVAFDSDQATQVIAAVSGPVSRLIVSVGAKVEPGDPLAVIASPDFAAAVSTYRKVVAAARNARRIADLDEQLFKSDGISRREMEQAQTDAIGAEADRDAAQQQLRSLGVNDAALKDIQEGRFVALGQAFIRAPIAGTVVERLITPGQLLQAGATPCFTIARMSTVWVMANLFESDLSLVQIGDPADVITAATPTSFPGKVDYIASVVDPNTRAIAVRIVTPNPTEILKKDMYVRVAIHSRAERTGLLLPVSALLRDDEDLPFVFVENSDHTFSRRRVTIGARAGEMQEVTAGLSAGEMVVTEGGLFMQFAQSQ